MTSITFLDSEGNKTVVEAKEGATILEVAREHDIDIEGACDGSLACATCHVIIDQEHFDLLPPTKDEEEDMLDLAFGVTTTSRLCCQVKVTKEIEGIIVTVPSSTRNISQ